MALEPQASFTAGELDPALHERTDLKKYNTGLKTLRNWVIGKTGRLVTRPGTKMLVETKTDDSKVLLHEAFEGTFLEVGAGYVRWYAKDGTLKDEIDTFGHTEQQIIDGDLILQNIRVRNQDYKDTFGTALIEKGSLENLITYEGGSLNSESYFKGTAVVPSTADVVTSGYSEGGTGYAVDYEATVVINGQEGVGKEYATSNVFLNSKLPTGSEQNTFGIKVFASRVGYASGSSDLENNVDEVRIYRRPDEGGAFGYIGSTQVYSVDGDDLIFDFVDFGGDADFSNNPPKLSNDIPGNFSFTGVVGISPDNTFTYQQRAIYTIEGKIFATRPFYMFDLFEDSPLSDNSCLVFKMNEQGENRILGFAESNGLLFFTNKGVYLHQGALGINNLTLDKMGDWVISEDVQPISIPGGVFFVDDATNSVRLLTFSEEMGVYVAQEVSIYSNHLFEDSLVKYWDFQPGRFPLLWTVFDDGDYASFTYERTQAMSAWARHDGKHPIENVLSIGRNTDSSGNAVRPYTLQVRKIGTKRYIERVLDRYPHPEDVVSNPEEDKYETIAYMDSIVTYKDLLNDDLSDDDLVLSQLAPTFSDGDVNTSSDSVNVAGHNFSSQDPVKLSSSGTLPEGLESGTVYYIIKVDDDNVKFAASEADAQSGTAIDITGASGGGTHTITGEWSANLQLAVTDDAIFPTGGDGAVGTIFRHFHPTDHTEVDLEIINNIDDNTVIVEPSVEFPSAQATNPRLYVTANTITGLDHLDGEDVSIVADGYVKASPNNNIEDYPTVTVSSGSINLPDSYQGAIVHVGLPITGDIETLDIDTVDQKPVLVESKTVNKVLVKTYKSRGLYIGSRFPSDDKLEGTDVTSVNTVKLEGADAYQVNYEEEDPITGNRYKQPSSERHEISLVGDWDSNGRVAIRQVDPIHAEILSIIPDFEIIER